jgi:L-ascorbate metabolism protein UlaG (beta-lactamase superfamily)
VAAPRVSLTFAGHSTFAIKLGQTRLVTDPLLRDRLLLVLRRHRGAGREVLGRADGVLISHLHLDHLDLPSLSMIGKDVPIVTAPGGARILTRRRFRSVVELAPGERTELAGVEVEATHAEHAGGRFLFGLGRGGAAGYLINGPLRIYFAGDTELFDGMEELRGRVDVAMLPIWVWGPRLGPGHLDPERAARALAMIRPRVAVPMHWGSIAPVGARRFWPWMLHEPAHDFVAHARRLAPDVDIRVLQPGETASLQ